MDSLLESFTFQTKDTFAEEPTFSEELIRPVPSDEIPNFPECDYDTNPTDLYKAIEAKKWDDVKHFLLSGKWSGSAEKAEQTPSTQACTWVTKYETSMDGTEETGKWTQLPIHAAFIYEAPDEVIRLLLKICPGSAKCADDQRMLPLHLAFRQGASDSTVGLLMDLCPEAVGARNFKGLTPVDCALTGAHPQRSKIIQTITQKNEGKWQKKEAKMEAKLRKQRGQINKTRQTLKTKEDEVASLNVAVDLIKWRQDQTKKVICTVVEELKDINGWYQQQEQKCSKEDIVEDLATKIASLQQIAEELVAEAERQSDNNKESPSDKRQALFGSASHLGSTPSRADTENENESVSAYSNGTVRSFWEDNIHMNNHIVFLGSTDASSGLSNGNISFSRSSSVSSTANIQPKASSIFTRSSSVPAKATIHAKLNGIFARSSSASAKANTHPKLNSVFARSTSANAKANIHSKLSGEELSANQEQSSENKTSTPSTESEPTGANRISVANVIISVEDKPCSINDSTIDDALNTKLTSVAEVEENSNEKDTPSSGDMPSSPSTISQVLATFGTALACSDVPPSSCNTSSVSTDCDKTEMQKEVIAETVGNISTPEAEPLETTIESTDGETTKELKQDNFESQAPLDLSSPQLSTTPSSSDMPPSPSTISQVFATFGTALACSDLSPSHCNYSSVPTDQDKPEMQKEVYAETASDISTPEAEPLESTVESTDCKATKQLKEDNFESQAPLDLSSPQLSTTPSSSDMPPSPSTFSQVLATFGATFGTALACCDISFCNLSSVSTDHGKTETQKEGIADALSNISTPEAEPLQSTTELSTGDGDMAEELKQDNFESQASPDSQSSHQLPTTMARTKPRQKSFLRSLRNVSSILSTNEYPQPSDKKGAEEDGEKSTENLTVLVTDESDIISKICKLEGLQENSQGKEAPKEDTVDSKSAASSEAPVDKPKSLVETAVGAASIAFGCAATAAAVATASTAATETSPNSAKSEEASACLMATASEVSSMAPRKAESSKQAAEEASKNDTESAASTAKPEEHVPIVPIVATASDIASKVSSAALNEELDNEASSKMDDVSVASKSQASQPEIHGVSHVETSKDDTIESTPVDTSKNGNESATAAVESGSVSMAGSVKNTNGEDVPDISTAGSVLVEEMVEVEFLASCTAAEDEQKDTSSTNSGWKAAIELNEDGEFEAALPKAEESPVTDKVSTRNEDVPTTTVMTTSRKKDMRVSFRGVLKKATKTVSKLVPKPKARKSSLVKTAAAKPAPAARKQMFKSFAKPGGQSTKVSPL